MLPVAVPWGAALCRRVSERGGSSSMEFHQYNVSVRLCGLKTYDAPVYDDMSKVSGLLTPH